MKSLIEAVQSSKPACGAGVALSLFGILLGVVGFAQPFQSPSELHDVGRAVAVSLIQKAGFALLTGLSVALLVVFLKPFRRPISE